VNEAIGRGNLDSVRRQLVLATHFLSFALLSGGGIMVLLRQQLVSVVWGPDFVQASRIFVPLVLASSLVAIALPATNVLMSTSQRQATLATSLSVASSVLGCASWLVLVPAYDALGVAVGLLLGRAAYAVAVMWRVRQDHPSLLWSGLVLRAAILLAVLAMLDTVVDSPAVRLMLYVLTSSAVVASDAPVRDLIRKQVSWKTRR
jgi:O-antigen/teichoic acid export membrane protein